MSTSPPSTDVPWFNGRAVRPVRRAAGLSSSALLKRVAEAGHSLSLPTLSRLERGEGCPRPDTAKAIAEALGLELSDFMTEPPPTPRRSRSRSACVKEAPVVVRRFEGRLVRQVRTAAGLSAPQLRERITAAGHSLSLAGLTRIERGGGTQPETAQAIADALGVDLTALTVAVELPRPRRVAAERACVRGDGEP